jgi:hypothetical protein
MHANGAINERKEKGGYGIHNHMEPSLLSEMDCCYFICVANGYIVFGSV